MPRANRRRRDEVPLALGRLRGGGERRETHRGRSWFVRPLSGATSERAYLCPGCQHDIAPLTAHVVVWPADGMGGVDDRRHWHTRCWGRY
ncbi:MAG: hypothetical protein LWW86_13020 [Micrococcales bacterium]|nr:hypothetical protein [Micrococcales bacterium]